MWVLELRSKQCKGHGIFFVSFPFRLLLIALSAFLSNRTKRMIFKVFCDPGECVSSCVVSFVRQDVFESRAGFFLESPATFQQRQG